MHKENGIQRKRQLLSDTLFITVKYLKSKIHVPIQI